MKRKFTAGEVNSSRANYRKYIINRKGNLDVQLNCLTKDMQVCAAPGEVKTLPSHKRNSLCRDVNFFRKCMFVVSCVKHTFDKTVFGYHVYITGFKIFRFDS